MVGRLFHIFRSSFWVMWGSGNVRGVPRFSYKVVNFFWRIPNEFIMIRMRYRCKIIKVGNRLVQGRIDQQYGQFRYHSLGFLGLVGGF